MSLSDRSVFSCMPMTPGWCPGMFVLKKKVSSTWLICSFPLSTYRHPSAGAAARLLRTVMRIFAL
jgi:hypothetical protein